MQHPKEWNTIVHVPLSRGSRTVNGAIFRGLKYTGQIDSKNNRLSARGVEVSLLYIIERPFRNDAWPLEAGDLPPTYRWYM